MNVVVLVPRRADDGWRDQLWEFTRSIWQERFPDWPIFEGLHEEDEGPFNRSAAINRAADAADAAVGRWDVAVIIDADIIPDPAAVRSIVERTFAYDQMCVSHTRRVMLSQRMTRRVMSGYTGSWEATGQKVWTDSCSCCIALSRTLWNGIIEAGAAYGSVGTGAFDEGFVGWGFEDSALGELAKLVGGPEHYEPSTLFHLWHPPSRDASPGSEVRMANEARLIRLRRSIERGPLPAPVPLPVPSVVSGGRIPPLLHRTVPATTSAEVEEWWDRFVELHPTWETRTWREPLDPADFPLTSPMWDRCANGAQKAGLIRLELLVTYGGIYVDSDVEPFRPWDQLLAVEAFCGWEDEKVIPDAVLGARPGHPAFVEALNQALSIIADGGDAWHSGPGVTTALLPNRDDVLVLPPGSFFPYHYLELHKRGSVGPTKTPWAFGAHHWHGSWLSPDQRKTNESRQRR